MKPLIIKGIDTLEFGLDIKNYLDSIKPLLDKFKIIKEEAQKSGEDQEIVIGDINLTVHATGIRFHAYRLSCNDFFMYFMEKEMKENPPVRVKFLSSYLWSYGFKEAFDKFIEWFEHNFDVSIEGNRISRVDICVDTDEAKFVENDFKDIITKAKKKQRHYASLNDFKYGNKFSGFTVGSGGSISARIYNKSLEVKNSGKVWFHQVWEENGWDDSKDVWRVEFQLRRLILKECNIDSVEQLCKKEERLWSYLTEMWLSLRRHNGENVSRNEIKRKWQLIQNAGVSTRVSPIVRNVVKLGNIERLLDQCVGITLSVSALGNHKSLDDTLKIIKNWTELKLDKKQTTFENEKCRRIRKFMS